MICLKIRTFVVSATTSSPNTLPWFKLWFAWKFVPLWYQQQPESDAYVPFFGCDLLENSYLCGISNNSMVIRILIHPVVICLKIRTFVVSATTVMFGSRYSAWLWFAWKFVPLWYQQQQTAGFLQVSECCDLLENSYLCGISNNQYINQMYSAELWFAWKFVPLWYQQQHTRLLLSKSRGCDLLENSYLCGISNNW